MEGLVDHLEQETLLRIHYLGFHRAEAKEGSVEEIGPFHKCPMPDCHLAWHFWIRVEVLVHIPPVCRDLSYRIDLFCKSIPHLPGCCPFQRESASPRPDSQRLVVDKRSACDRALGSWASRGPSWFRAHQTGGEGCHSFRGGMVEHEGAGQLDAQLFGHRISEVNGRQGVQA